MNSKPMLFECLDCSETYLADNLCDGCKCPKCNGHVVGIGFVKEIEEGLKDMQNKIIRAKENGLIRTYPKSAITKTLYADGEPYSKLIGVVDLSGKKDSTVHTININVSAENIDKDKLIEEIIKKLNNPKGPRRSGFVE